MRGLVVRRRGGAVRLAVLLIPAVVAGGLFLGGVTRSADAAETAPNATLTPSTTPPFSSTSTASTSSSSSSTSTSTSSTSTSTSSTTPTTFTTLVEGTTVETEPPVVTTTQPVPTTAVEPDPSLAAAVEATDATVAPEAVVAMTEGVVAMTEGVVATTLAPPTNQSTCRSDLPGAVMTITMADIAYMCAVYPGGQAVIDAGVATVITAKESPFALAAGPGESGTLWITGHRVSHGGPFAAVPELADGAIITVSSGTVTASYVIVGRAYVQIRDGLAVDATGTTSEAATMDAVLRPDRNAELAPRLLLQTCDSENFRWMIYADLVTA